MTRALMTAREMLNRTERMIPLTQPEATEQMSVKEDRVFVREINAHSLALPSLYLFLYFFRCLKLLSFLY